MLQHGYGNVDEQFHASDIGNRRDALNRPYEERRFKRYVKGMRRVKEDRAQHGPDHRCACFQANGAGREFAFFADTPKRCSYPTCCGNPRGLKGSESFTRQERKAPQVSDW